MTIVCYTEILYAIMSMYVVTSIITFCAAHARSEGRQGSIQDFWFGEEAQVYCTVYCIGSNSFGRGGGE
jgi:hypothetical protein